tara:strand:+ start:42 stop:470 length:429 start_codon:yes stop_codon:yes gene_type:complete
MTTYKSLKTLCESFGMSFYEIPELSDQELNIIPEDASKHGNDFVAVHDQPHSLETKRLLSEIAKKRIKHSMQGKTHSEEAKKKMSDSAKKRERSYSEETIEKWRQARLGKPSPMSQEARKKLSEAIIQSNKRRAKLNKEGKV